MFKNIVITVTAPKGKNLSPVCDSVVRLVKKIKTPVEFVFNDVEVEVKTKDSADDVFNHVFKELAKR